MDINSVQAIETSCRHCGQLSYKGDFCCPGCAAAYSLINELGLDSFYSKVTAPLIPLDSPNSDSLTWNEADLEKFETGEYRCRLLVRNLTCSACVWLLEKLPEIYPFIKSVRVDYQSKVAAVIFSDQSSPNDILKVFEKFGFAVSFVSSNDIVSESSRDLRKWYLWVAVAVGSWLANMHVGLSLIAGVLSDMDTSTSRHLGVISAFLTLPSVLFSAQPFYNGAKLALKNKTLTLDSLVSFSVFLGFTISVINIIEGRNEFYFDAITMLVAFLLISRLIVKFVELKLATERQAFVKNILHFENKIEIGDRIFVKSGARFPCDGRLVSGQSEMESSWLTGESTPVKISKGDLVFCGAANLGDLVEVECTASGASTRVGQLVLKLNSVGKSHFIEFSHRLESILISTMALGLTLFAIYGLVTGTFDRNVFVSLLLITCPCALGVAIPLTIATAIKQAFQNGIFIKDASSFEKLQEIQAIILDKTGTITTSQPRLIKEHWSESTSVHLNVLSNLLKRSEHITTKSLQPKYLHDLKPDIIEKFKNYSGLGVEGFYKNQCYRLGSAMFVGVKPEACQSNSMLYFKCDKNIVASFELESDISEDTFELVNYLNSDYETFLLSGDAEAPVRKAAQELGLPNARIYYGQTPEDKLIFVKDLAVNKKVMMVGDGINDSLAFKAAHVSVGVNGAAHLALEASDIYFSKPGLSQLKMLFAAARRVKSFVVFNYIWSLVFNVVGIYYVLNGSIGPIVCAVLMPASSAFVVLVSATPNYFKKSKGQL